MSIVKRSVVTLSLTQPYFIIRLQQEIRKVVLTMRGGDNEDSKY